MCENTIIADKESSVSEIADGKYKVYELFDSRAHVSTEYHTPPYSSASTFNTPPAICIKIEHGIHIYIHLSDASVGDEPIHSTHTVKPSPSSLRPPSVTSFLCRFDVPFFPIPSQTLHFHPSMSL